MSRGPAPPRPGAIDLALPVPSAPFERSERLARLARYVEANPASPLSAAEAASLLGLDRTYFSKFFLEHVGLPFSDWNRSVRLRRALELLGDSNIPIPAVADRCGFGSVRTLQRWVKSVSGLTPQEYRVRRQGRK